MINKMNYEKLNLMINFINANILFLILIFDIIFKNNQVYHIP